VERQVQNLTFHSIAESAMKIVSLTISLLRSQLGSQFIFWLSQVVRFPLLDEAASEAFSHVVFAAQLQAKREEVRRVYGALPWHYA